MWGRRVFRKAENLYKPVGTALAAVRGKAHRKRTGTSPVPTISNGRSAFAQPFGAQLLLFLRMPTQHKSGPVPNMTRNRFFISLFSLRKPLFRQPPYAPFSCASSASAGASAFCAALHCAAAAQCAQPAGTSCAAGAAHASPAFSGASALCSAAFAAAALPSGVSR